MTAVSLSYTTTSSQEALQVLFLHRITFSSLLLLGQPFPDCFHVQFQRDRTEHSHQVPGGRSEAAGPSPHRPRPPPSPWRHPAENPAAGGRAEGAAPSPARAGRGGPVPGATASHRGRRSGDGHGASRAPAACSSSSSSSPAAARRTAGIREPRRAGERGAGPGRLCLLLPGGCTCWPAEAGGRALLCRYAGAEPRSLRAAFLPPRSRMLWGAGRAPSSGGGEKVPSVYAWGG